MWFPKSLVLALDAALGDATLSGRRAYALMGRAILRLFLQSLLNLHRDALIVDRSRLAGTQFVIRAGDPIFQKTPTPLSRRRVVTIKARRHGPVALPFPSRRPARSAHASSAPTASSANAQTRTTALVQPRSKSAPLSVDPWPSRCLQPDDVGHLLDEEGIGGELEGHRTMRLHQRNGHCSARRGKSIWTLARARSFLTAPLPSPGQRTTPRRLPVLRSRPPRAS
jgi:hypothetical protein